MTDLVTAILIVTGAVSWIAILCVVAWTLVVQGVEWHRAGCERLARDDEVARRLLPRLLDRVDETRHETREFDAWEHEMPR